MIRRREEIKVSLIDPSIVMIMLMMMMMMMDHLLSLLTAITRGEGRRRG